MRSVPAPRTRLSVDHQIAALGNEHHGLVPVAMLRDAGYSAHEVQRRVSKHILESARRGVRVRGGIQLDLTRRAFAAAYVVPDGWVSHTTALTLCGLDLADYGVHISAPKQHRLLGVTSHRHATPHRSLLQRSLGVKMSTPTLAIIESAAVLDVRTLTVALDWALHQRRTTIRQVDKAILSAGRFSGLVALRELVKERMDGVGLIRSFFEADLDGVLRRHRLPVGRRNYTVQTPEGRRVLDVAWPELKVALEADSWKHHSSPGDWGRTRTRDRALLAMGWIVIPVVYADIRNPAQLIEQLRRIISLCS
jgi:very-short-patch-repair endonuclease